ncbi:hypothetical protein HN014_03835 [Aquimarina sp. TRL1]|uniref:hypothetical protein n=1 Tax=Aquimarina sp. (strain TRL1) TaxID=2736252 RepID=UPI001589405B|nr:hypothetical protein [Aquimarina sp. TRL1]QKX04072.1 hypothetical protein HN014_03835 [Aquimarina sp. TRL1]
MEEGCRIADAMNTYNSALGIIKTKGYKVFFYPSNTEDFHGDFIAVKGLRQFMGSDPLRVLGLISIWENTGDDWQSYIPEEDIYDKVLSWALPDSVEDYNKLTDREFNDFVTNYRLFFREILNKPFPEDPTRQEMFDLIDPLCNK